MSHFKKYKVKSANVLFDFFPQISLIFSDSFLFFLLLLFVINTVGKDVRCFFPVEEKIERPEILPVGLIVCQRTYIKLIAWAQEISHYRSK